MKFYASGMSSKKKSNVIYGYGDDVDYKAKKQVVKYKEQDNVHWGNLKQESTK